MAKKIVKKTTKVVKVEEVVEVKPVTLKVTVGAKCEYCGKFQSEREAIFCDDYCKDTYVAKH